MIAFTNHALDHMLNSVLDAGITQKVIRLGGRSADEKISKYSMETLETVAGQSRLDRTFAAHFRELKLNETALKDLMYQVTRTTVASDEIIQHLAIQYPEHHEEIYNPPDWVALLHSLMSQDSEGWQAVGRRGIATEADNSLYAFWRDGRDIAFLTTRPEPAAVSKPREKLEPPPAQNSFAALRDLDDDGSSQSSAEDEDDDTEPWQRIWVVVDEPSNQPNDGEGAPGEAATVELAVESSVPVEESDSIGIADLRNPAEFFTACGMSGVPAIPTLDRELDDLLFDGKMWTLSLIERDRLDQAWTKQIRTSRHEDHIDEFKKLRTQRSAILEKYKQGKDEVCTVFHAQGCG